MTSMRSLMVTVASARLFFRRPVRLVSRDRRHIGQGSAGQVCIHLQQYDR